MGRNLTSHSPGNKPQQILQTFVQDTFSRLGHVSQVHLCLPRVIPGQWFRQSYLYYRVTQYSALFVIGK